MTPKNYLPTQHHVTSEESVNSVTLIQYLYKFRLWVEWGEAVTKPVG